MTLAAGKVSPITMPRLLVDGELHLPERRAIAGQTAGLKAMMAARQA